MRYNRRNNRSRRNTRRNRKRTLSESKLRHMIREELSTLNEELNKKTLLRWNGGRFHGKGKIVSLDGIKDTDGRGPYYRGLSSGRLNREVIALNNKGIQIIKNSVNEILDSGSGSIRVDKIIGATIGTTPSAFDNSGREKPTVSVKLIKLNMDDGYVEFMFGGAGRSVAHRITKSDELYWNTRMKIEDAERMLDVF